MSDFTISVHDADMLRSLRDAGHKIHTMMPDAALRAMRMFETKVVREQISGRPGLINHHGNSGMAGSFSTALEATAGGWWTVKMRTAKKYTRIHQYGGVIKPKKGKYLWFKIHTSNRIMSKSGKPLKKSKREFTWIRTKSVTIPKRLNIVEDFYASATRMVLFEMIRAIRKAIR